MHLNLGHPGLMAQAAWNQGMLQTSDMARVGEAMMTGKAPEFDDVET